MSKSVTSKLMLAALLALASHAAYAGGDGGGGGEAGGGVSLLPTPQRGGGAASSRDPATGVTITVLGNPDGSATIITRGPDGRIIRQGQRGARPAPPPPGRKPLFIHERDTSGGRSVSTYDNGDGTATNVTRDAQGREIGRSTFTGRSAQRVIADAEKARGAPPPTIVIPR